MLPVAPPGINEHLVELLEAAAQHSTTTNFERLVNKWIKAETRCAGSALLLFAVDYGRVECSVCCERLLCGGAIDCGTIESFTKMFAYSDEVTSTSSSICEATRTSIRTICERMLATPRGADVNGNGIDENEPVENETIVADDDDDNLLAGSDPPFTLLPIHAKSGLIAALALFHRSRECASTEVEWLRGRLRLIASLLGIVLNIEQQKRLAQQSQIFLSMAQNVFSSLDDMSQLVRNITREAKTLVQAETCSLFLLDKERGELVAEVFEKNGLTNDYLTEVRVPMSEGIVGQVATTGIIMNVKDAYSHPDFYRNVDSSTGFFTRNMLCLPIKDAAGELIGVAELCNKLGRSNFTEHDEHIASAFSVYCAISISHCLLYRKLQEAQRRHNVASELMITNDSTIKVTEEEVERLSKAPIKSSTEFHPHFNQILFIPRLVNSLDKQMDAVVTMYSELGFLNDYHINQSVLARFLLTVKQGYRNVPYHNWCHAFAVTHYMYLLLRLPQTKKLLSSLEALGLLTASLCHDIDHRGTTNAFQVQSKTPLAQLYSSMGSVLERHHFAQTVCILNKDDCNILANLNRNEYQTVLDNIREIILATDIATHFRRKDRIAAMLEQGYTPNNPEHHRLLMCVMMNTSDISDQSKDWPASKTIAASIYTEFFSQGDLEKAMGSNPSEMMDRERASIPKLQIDFFDVLALPLFSALSSVLTDTKASFQCMQRNRKCWETMGQVIASPSGTNQLDLMTDETVERMVIEQVDGYTIPATINENDERPPTPSPSVESSNSIKNRSSTSINNEYNSGGTTMVKAQNSSAPSLQQLQQQQSEKIPPKQQQQKTPPQQKTHKQQQHQPIIKPTKTVTMIEPEKAVTTNYSAQRAHRKISPADAAPLRQHLQS